MTPEGRRREPVRSPRVQIVYESEVAGESRRRELPFVLGVLGNFAGTPEEPLPRLRDRQFVEVNRDNFNAVLRSMKPRLAFRVDNKLTDDGTRIAVTLGFQSLGDFEPEQVAKQVEPLRKLIEVRQQLSALLSTIGKKPQLGERLREIVAHSERLRTVATEPASDKSSRGDGSPR